MRPITDINFFEWAIMGLVVLGCLPVLYVMGRDWWRHRGKGEYED